MNRILAVIGAPLVRLLFQDVKSERTLTHIAPLYPRIQVHGVLVVFVDQHAAEQSGLVHAQIQRPRRRAPQYKPCFVIDQRPDIVGERVVKRVRINRFSGSRP